MVSAKTGASAFRSSASRRSGGPDGCSAKLNQYSNQLYAWLDIHKSSRIRTMPLYQGARGLPYVVSDHHHASQCFLLHDSTAHDGGAGNRSNTRLALQSAVEGGTTWGVRA